MLNIFSCGWKISIVLKILIKHLISIVSAVAVAPIYQALK